MKNSLSIFAILILATLMAAFTESRTISGRVTDKSGRPIPGVSVRAKVSVNNPAVATTDRSGNYKITLDRTVKVLIFSINGYSDVEEIIGERTIINVSMQPDQSKKDKAPAAAYEQKEAVSQRSSVMASPSSVIKYVQGGTFQPSGDEFNTEGYASVEESGFRTVKNSPLSTFSIDVDNASYSNVRRFINMGTLPPAEAVRIEEMINYFKYDYPEPRGEHPFSVYTELAICPWNKSHYLLHAGLRARNIDKASLPASNLVFLIDVSGSMRDPVKLPLLKSAFGLLVNELRPQDRVAIVVYAGAAGLVLESTPGNRKETIMSAIDKLEAGGSTAGGAGLRLAYAEAQKHFVRGGNNRIILATDGDFNVGESSNGGMERLVEENREAGVFITVLGFGMGNVKDDKMELIADKGNGNYSYIDNLQEARRVLVREFGGTLFTIAKDVKFQIEFNPAKVESYRLIGYENRLLNAEDFNDDKKDAGEMGAGHNVTALYELIPSGSDEKIPSVDPLKYQASHPQELNDDDQSDEYLTIKLRYKKPDGTTSRLLEKPVAGSVEMIGNASENLRFASAVAEFGMILRNSGLKGGASLESAIELASKSKGADEDGYRAEFIRLMKTVKDMKLLSVDE